jgi:translation initiation factor 1
LQTTRSGPNAQSRNYPSGDSQAFRVSPKKYKENKLMSKPKVVYREFGAPEPEEDVDSSPLDLPPQQQNLRIQASRKGRKGKTVTVISGFAASPETLASLVKQLKNYCGAGGTVKDNEIEIQGDCAQKVLQFLAKLGYKAKISGG